MSRKLISLETWLAQTYGGDAPGIATARRWARDGKIYPAPEKHGRRYFVDPDARYTDRPRRPGKLRLVDRIAETEIAGQRGFTR